MQGDADSLKVFTGRANPLLAEKICKHLNIELGRGRTELFPDGELIVRVGDGEVLRAKRDGASSGQALNARAGGRDARDAEGSVCDDPA